MNPSILPALSWNGIDAATGGPLLPAPTLAQIVALARGQQLPAAEVEELRRWRERSEKDHLDTRFGVDPRDLAQTGWGVIFPEERQDELHAALAPLLELRRSQASLTSDRRYREIAYRGEPKGRFLARHGAGNGPADPDVLPYYLLLAGSPEEISFRFQYQLDVQYAVGRICFESLDEYARYAESVVAAERGRVTTRRRVSLLGVSHPGDGATESSRRELVEPLAAYLAQSRPGWSVETVLGEGATKGALGERLGGAETPALLFTASHGMGIRPDAPHHRAHQGALLCQDWPGDRPVVPDDYLAAEDVAESASPAGLVAFFFACYGAGTPAIDSFRMEGEPERRAAADFVARLPQRLLAHPRGGALAVLGHVDRAWTFSYSWPTSGAHLQVFESALGRLLDGYPVGAATEYFNQRFAELATDLAEEREAMRWGAQPDPLDLADLWTASQDARSYAVLGDPAVRLAVASTLEG